MPTLPRTFPFGGTPPRGVPFQGPTSEPPFVFSDETDLFGLRRAPEPKVEAEAGLTIFSAAMVEATERQPREYAASAKWLYKKRARSQRLWLPQTARPALTTMAPFAV